MTPKFAQNARKDTKFVVSEPSPSSPSSSSSSSRSSSSSSGNSSLKKRDSGGLQSRAKKGGTAEITAEEKGKSTVSETDGCDVLEVWFAGVHSGEYPFITFIRASSLLIRHVAQTWEVALLGMKRNTACRISRCGGWYGRQLLAGVTSSSTQRL